MIALKGDGKLPRCDGHKFLKLYRILTFQLGYYLGGIYCRSLMVFIK